MNIINGHAEICSCLSCEDTELTIYKGNTVSFYVIPKYEDGTRVELKEGDKILFSVSSKPGNKNDIVISKTVDKSNEDENGFVKVVLAPEDTSTLLSSLYYYDIAILFSDGSFYTFIPCSRFVLKDTIGSKSMLEN